MTAAVEVLLLCARLPPAAKLERITAKLRTASLTASLVSLRSPKVLPAGAFLTHVQALRPVAEAHGPGFRRALASADFVEGFWLYVSHDPWVASRLRSPAVLLALDEVADKTARRLADEYAHVSVVATAAQAVRAVGQMSSSGASLMAGGGANPERPTGEAWSDGSDDEAASYVGARNEVLALVEAEQLDIAEALTRRTAPEFGNRRLSADLLGDFTNAVLARGASTDLALDTYAAELAIGDQHLHHGRLREAALSFAEAMRVCFHRTLHFDDLTSPLAADARSYTEPLRESTTLRMLGAPRGRAVSPTTAAGRSDVSARPTRVLILTRKNANFLTELREHLHEHRDAQVRFVDLVDDEVLTKFAGDPVLIAEELLADQVTLEQHIESILRDHVEWADVVFVEWCLAQAVFATMIDPRDTRVVIRLHSQEVFTPWPQLVDFSRVDDMVFVSAHLRDLALSAIPGLQAAEAPAVHVIPNALNLQRYVRPKPPDARFRLALVGWGSAAKDPRWALQVITLLREQDQRYELLLVGSDFREDFGAASRAYAAELWPELTSLEAAGAVRRLGHTDDVPESLTTVGVILSTSVRESFHASVVEGAASGGVPVVRDWPFFAGKPNGARTLFPADWVVATPEEAVERILRTTATEAAWQANGVSASEQALRDWDWSVVRQRYDDLLLR